LHQLSPPLISDRSVAKHYFEPMRPAVSMICGVTFRACHAVYLLWSPYLLSSDGLNFVDRYLGRITALVAIFQFACSVELFGSLLWSPILSIQRACLAMTSRPSHNSRSAVLGPSDYGQLARCIRNLLPSLYDVVLSN